MGCEHCEVTAEIDGRSVHVRLRTENIDEIATDKDRVATLYRCPKCGAYWELGGFDKAAEQVSAEHVGRHYGLQPG